MKIQQQNDFFCFNLLASFFFLTQQPNNDRPSIEQHNNLRNKKVKHVIKTPARTPNRE